MHVHLIRRREREEEEEEEGERGGEMYIHLQFKFSSLHIINAVFVLHNDTKYTMKPLLSLPIINTSSLQLLSSHHKKCTSNYGNKDKFTNILYIPGSYFIRLYHKMSSS